MAEREIAQRHFEINIADKIQSLTEENLVNYFRVSFYMLISVRHFSRAYITYVLQLTHLSVSRKKRPITGHYAHFCEKTSTKVRGKNSVSPRTPNSGVSSENATYLENLFN